jgi:putative Mg2+ transporter-C (MgtC) family protein
MDITTAEILKLLLAVVIGGGIGLERQLHHKAAGFRTITLICIGATLFTILSYRIPGAVGITNTIVTGIGFLGGGVILHETNRVTGLTTAATIWLSAAVGMGIGAGAYLLSICSAVIALIVIRVFSNFEEFVDAFWESRQYKITMPNNPQKIEALMDWMLSCGLKGVIVQKMKFQNNLLCTISAAGSLKKQNHFVDLLLGDAEISDVQW